MRFTYNQDDIRKKKQRIRKEMKEQERSKKESQKKEKERERDKERDTEKESEIVIYYETEWGKMGRRQRVRQRRKLTVKKNKLMIIKKDLVF